MQYGIQFGRFIHVEPETLSFQINLGVHMLGPQHTADDPWLQPTIEPHFPICFESGTGRNLVPLVLTGPFRNQT